MTNQGPAGAKLLDDYAGQVFEPSQAITRQQLAAALVTASGHLGDTVAAPLPLADLAATSPYFHAVQVAIALRLLAPSHGDFYPNGLVAERQADRALVRMIRLMNPDADWSMLGALQPSRWEPVRVEDERSLCGCPGRWRRAFWGLRYNHLSAPASRSRPRRTSTGPMSPTCSR